VAEPIRSTAIQAAPRPEVSRWRRPLQKNDRANSVFGIPALLGKLRSLWWWWALLLGICAFPMRSRAQVAESECGGLMNVGDKFLFYTDGEWPAGTTVTLHIHEPLPAGVSPQQALNAAALATESWNEALCNQLNLLLNPVVLDAEAPAPEAPTATMVKECEQQREAGVVAGEIVVCREVVVDNSQRFSGSHAAWLAAYAARTQGANTIPPPDVAGPGIFRGEPSISGLCFIPPCPAEPALMIDVAAIPPPPPGSDAERVAQGLAPREADDAPLSDEDRRRKEAELGLPEATEAD
jgi:hypothetical protein